MDSNSKFYTTFDELGKAMNILTIDDLIKRLDSHDIETVKHDYQWLKDITIGVFKMENFYLACLNEILDNKNLFAVASRDFVPIEPIKSFFKVRSVARYIYSRFYENQEPIQARIANINTVLLIQKNHYLIASHFNSIYLHNFTLLKDNKADNVLTKVIEQIMNGDSENPKENISKNSQGVRP